MLINHMILPFIQQSSLQYATVSVVLAKLQISSCCHYLSAHDRTKNITISTPFLLVLFTISVYHKFKCLRTFALIALMPCGMTVQPWFSVLSRLQPWHVITTLIAKLILDCGMWYRKWLLILSRHDGLLPSSDCHFYKENVRKKCNRDISR